ncbi:MAG: A/G-specific adenine glycosylase [Cyanobacteriota bacterium]|nr:A/G-specific adenine glycosylase [Cyanobacteriota bacterium]
MTHLEPDRLQWFRRRLRSWGKENLRDFPWRRTQDPYRLFVAEFLLQKTNAATVAPIYETLIDRYPYPEQLAAVPIEEVAQILKPLGLFFRAERLSQSIETIVRSNGGRIPKTEAALLELPGVGKYTARAILAGAFNRRAAVLDTNVARILERFFGIEGERVKSRCKLLWAAADEAAPTRYVGRWNLTLLDFGAAVCTARNPQCDRCPLSRQCTALRAD